MPSCAAREVNRIATGDPVLSPKVKIEPPTVVTRRFPVRINFPSAARSNRSIGRLHRHAQDTIGVQPALPQDLGRGSARPRARPDLGIKTKSASRGNGAELRIEPGPGS